jgi:hypothetical protein
MDTGDVGAVKLLMRPPPMAWLVHPAAWLKLLPVKM